MAEQPIDFSNKEASGLAVEAGGSPVAVNVLREPTGAVRRRPGLSAYTLIGTNGEETEVVDTNGIVGIYKAQDGKIYAVGGSPLLRHIYCITNGIQDLSASGGFTLLSGRERPIFAETEALLVIATGKQMQKIEFSSSASSRLGDTASPSDPPLATHVVANQSRLVANDSDFKSFLRFSDQAAGSSFAGHEYWLMAGIGTSGFVSADARPDPVVAIHDNTNEVFVWGAATLQVFVPDGQSIYAPAATRQYGTVAPYSVIPLDQEFFWFDNLRRFVHSDGRNIEVISEPIQQTLDNLNTVDDCFGYRFSEGPFDALVWTFPTEELTFCYQQGSGWSRWAGWNGNWTGFPVTCGAVTENENVVGTGTGKVGELAMANKTDFGEPIRAYVETGFTTRGTDRRKRTNAVRISLKRGHTTGSGEPVGWLGWRDRPGVTAGRIPVGFGRSTDTEITVPHRSLGVYRRRQWFFEFTGTDDFVLASVTEDFDVLPD